MKDHEVVFFITSAPAIDTEAPMFVFKHIPKRSAAPFIPEETPLAFQKNTTHSRRYAKTFQKNATRPSKEFAERRL